MTSLSRSCTRASTLEIAAHEYVASGWPVLPLEPCGKKPLTRHGFKDATRCHDQVANYWSRTPDANVGIATGVASGLFVVDVDGSDGDRALTSICDIPVTIEARTSKGRHLYFEMPDGIELGLTVNGIAKQIDTRGNGGYIVAPPSVHPSGHVYGWAPGRSPDAIDLGRLPDALIFALMKKPKPKRIQVQAPRLAVAPSNRGRRAALQAFLAFLARAPRCLAEGKGRNVEAFKISCFAIKVMPFSDVQVVLNHWNSSHRPPLSTAELNSVLRSAVRRVGGKVWP